MKSLKIAAIAPAGLVLFIACGSTIPAGSKGVYRGKFSGTRAAVYKDGFKWHWPWNNVVTYDVRWKTMVEKLNILSADNLHMDVEVALRLRPTESEVHQLHTEIGPQYYPQVVQQPFRAIETQRALANSSNATFYFVPIGKDGLPVIIEAPTMEKKRVATNKQ